MGTNDRPKEYEVSEPEGWTEAVASFPQRRLDDGATVMLEGKCPRCKHTMDVELAIGERAFGLNVTDIRDDQSLEPRRPLHAPWKTLERSFRKIARCNCRHAHPGRPDEVSDGCGAFGALRVG